MQKLRKIALTAGLLFLPAAVVEAQNAAPAPPPAVEAPAPKPVDPAYQGLVAATETLNDDAALDTALKTNANLYEKQTALAEPKVRASVKALHLWLDLNELPSQELSYGIGEADPLFAKFGSFTRMAKTLEIRQYVLLADGRVSDAIDTTRDGLRLAVSLENHSLVGCLTGFALEDTVLRPFAAHLDQLSLNDCARLTQLTQDWNKTPNAIIFALDRERRALTKTMQKFTGEDGKKLRDMMQKIPDNVVKPDSKEAVMIAQIKSLDDDGWKRLMNGLAKGVDTIFAQATLDMQTPIYQRAAPKPAAPNKKPDDENASQDAVTSLLDASTAAIRPQINNMESEYVKRAVYAHLLGCHAAIHKYHWENNRWPDSLKDLKLEDMATDPFSGNPLVYKRDKDSYTLESVGAPVYDKDGKPDEKARIPISLPEKPRDAAPVQAAQGK